MSDNEIKLDKYFYAVWRAKWLIVGAVVLTAAIAAVMAAREPTLYTASGLIQIGRVWKEPLEDPYATAEITSSPGFLNQLAVRIGEKAAYLKRSVHAEAVTAGPPRSAYPILVRIIASTPSPDESVRLARAVADEVISRHKQQYDKALESHLERQKKLETRYEQLARSNSIGLAPSEALIALERELDEVRSSNTSPTHTFETHLEGDIVAAATIGPAVARSAIVAALVTAVVATVAALIAGHFATSRADTSGQGQHHAQSN